MNLATQIGVSVLTTSGIWLAGYLVRRRVARLATEAGVEWPAEGVGLEVSPGLLRVIAVTEWLYRVRFTIIGPLFGLNFVCINWFAKHIA